eukprot:241763-Chlamydomonas_euryale.AAC.1
MRRNTSRGDASASRQTPSSTVSTPSPTRSSTHLWADARRQCAHSAARGRFKRGGLRSTHAHRWWCAQAGPRRTVSELQGARRGWKTSNSLGNSYRTPSR